ncbi:hypothetical protein FHS76_004399 [Ochrobactrum daejeonense]|uniref:Uncharacterized protein n=1 Tax=Brucella daejeonensis TaxID=659015 RepID=A0A7W9B1X0_9HYPH|nr:hypothetical protein [Brucella daejeonensis]
MAWVERANRHDGAVFRGSDHWGNLDPKSFSAHGLRSGYLTEAARNGVPCPKRCSSRSTNPSVRRTLRATTLNGPGVKPRG